MPPIPGMVHWHSLIARHAKDLKTAFSKALRTLDAQITGKPQTQLEPILAKNTPKHPLHPLARIRQGQSRWYSTARKQIESAVRHFSTPAHGRNAGTQYERASFPKSRVGAYIQQSSGRAPFASTLRPNLTGGTLGRTAGGYSLGSGRAGGARYFSHGPACQAQVVQNVSQAVRAFFVGGQKAQFDGVSPHTGEKRYQAVSALQQETGRKLRELPKATPGSWVDFQVNPTITALTPLSTITGFNASNTTSADHLNTEGLLDVLSVDFSRTLKDLAAVFNDLKRLSALGDLPLTYEGSHLRVHFPGSDADTVERLCCELGITRGTVIQDEAFDAFAGTEIALLFPFAPGTDVFAEDDIESYFDTPAATKFRPIEIQSMFTPSEAVTPAYSTQSAQSASDLADEIAENPWLSPSPSGYESVRSNGSGYESEKHSPLEYQGFEGIYRFIEELDSVRR